jgi:hypothetical protein
VKSLVKKSKDKGVINKHLQNTFEYVNANDWKSEISSDEDYSDSDRESSENVGFKPPSV